MLLNSLANKYKQNPSIKNATFVTMILSLDKSVGSVLKVLEDLQEDKNKIVFLYSDNGGGTLRAYDLSRKKILGKEKINSGTLLIEALKEICMKETFCAWRKSVEAFKILKKPLVLNCN